jgi:pre-60S factor REI1
MASTDTDFDPYECLFCDVHSLDPHSSIEHMHKIHGLFIPEQDRLTDTETFLAYLHTIITDLHECLYCGSTKSTAEAARSHMRDRGHCMLNFDAEGELGMFWEKISGTDETVAGAQSETLFIDTNKVTSVDEDGLHLPSGKTLGHRNKSRQQTPRPASPKTESSTPQKAITDGTTSTGTTTDPRTQRQVVTRAHGGTGLIGVSQLQRRALIANEISTRKLELKAKAKYSQKVERSNDKTFIKRYRVCNISLRSLFSTYKSLIDLLLSMVLLLFGVMGKNCPG